MFISAIKAADAELRRDGAPWDLAGRDVIETLEHPPDVADGLLLAPMVAGIDIDVVEAA
jgi:uncharacterized protein YqfA (UPF0365 family)